MVPQRQVSRDPCNLQGREHMGKRCKIRAVPVSLTSCSSPCISLTLINARGRSNRIEMSRNFASEGEHRGNEHSRWHGMTRKCNFGDEGITDFCLDASCSLCCIIKSSYDLKHFGRKKHFGGAGVGIYTSASSSKFVRIFAKCIEATT